MQSRGVPIFNGIEPLDRMRTVSDTTADFEIRGVFPRGVSNPYSPDTRRPYRRYACAAALP